MYLVQGYIHLKESYDDKSSSVTLPRLVFAGGFDPNNLENKEYLDELAGRVKSTGLRYCLILPEKLKSLIAEEVMSKASSPKEAHVWFVPSFTDQQRSDSSLFSCAIVSAS